jgi:Protein of unknown function (DUF5672)
MKMISAVIIDTYPDKLIPHLAVRRTLELPNLGRLYTLSDQPFVPGATHHRIEPIRSLTEYSRIVLQVLPDIVQEDHFLLIQWDGMPVSQGAWDEAFLDYDYIGAPWSGLADHIAVGNGGFSLRSRKLLDTVRAMEIKATGDLNQGEDVLLCRQYRVRLEALGIKFAPVSVAARFSFETGTPPPVSFGFHNTFNFPLYFKEHELLEFAAQIIARQTNMQILLIYLHRLVHFKMNDLLRLSVQAIHSIPSLAAAVASQIGSFPIHDSVAKALAGHEAT